ncbi:SRPBCC domain-containing protein [Chitinophaga sp. Mgbs1]|uniref:SRPBCC domain-containing protein n=1 Tax=Chitinophaga solisilvae TaxID=1233460 RepID=A0A433WMU9_9BACT|nr:SRPBCC domain-containing protein [Chitinophaga solisilvae]
MSNKLAFDFTVDKENKTIVIKREFDAALPLVWDAYTKSEILDRWWGPKPWKARTRSQDFREGGSWHYSMIGPEGEEHWAVLNYITIENQKKFICEDAFADAAGNVNTDLPQARWVVTFTDKGPVTLVESLISFDDLAQLEKVIEMGMGDGLTMAMQNLDELLPLLKK